MKDSIITPGIYRFRNKLGVEKTRRVTYVDSKKVVVELVEERQTIVVPPDTFRRAWKLYGVKETGEA